jgi:hypothetical protein
MHGRNLGNWREGGLILREFRASKDGPEVITKNKRKNTRRWCKGKAGVNHVFKVKHSHWARFCFCMDVCENCGKEVYAPKCSSTTKEI